jgi:hypothetical protein
VKVSNFRDVTKSIDGEFTYARVWVTTGWGPWRRTCTRAVFKHKWSNYWRWIDSGEFAPDGINALQIAYDARAKAIQSY